MKLVLIDHHPHKFKYDHHNLKIITATNLKEFYNKSKEYINGEYDLAISDQDPDGYISLAIYLRRYKKIGFKCTREHLTKKITVELRARNVNNIIAFDWFPAYNSELDYFDEVIVINPHFSNFGNYNTSEILINLIESTEFEKELSLIASTCDYTIENIKGKFKNIINKYPKLFPRIIKQIENNKLSNDSIFKSKFNQITDMFWAPYVVNGKDGAEEVVKQLRDCEEFTYFDLILNSNNPTVKYLFNKYASYSLSLQAAKIEYEKNKIVLGKIIIGEIKPDHRLTSKFASILATHKYPNYVVVVKTKKSPSSYIYSIRTSSLDINLGQITKSIKNKEDAGGHPRAAGALVRDPESFEKELVDKIYSSLS